MYHTRVHSTHGNNRSIQKQIALELRELASRDRVSFDCNIVDPKEKQDGNLFVNNQHGDESYDDKKNEMPHIESIVMDEMIDINRYKFNGKI